MSRHSQPTSYKQDYREILSQRSPEQQLAVFKLLSFFVVLALILAYLFASA